jgi:hypothetical protein
MSVRTRVEPLDRDVKLIIDEMLSSAAQSAQFAAGAKQFLDEADDINRRVLGRVPRSHTFVDGSEGTPLASVKPDGVIVREYELVIDVLIFIADELRAASPVGRGPDKREGHPGFYKASHTLFADGTEVPAGGAIPDANEYVFLSDAPYTRKVEMRKTIYEMTAAKANARFGNIAKTRFTWRSSFTDFGGGGSAGVRSDMLTGPVGTLTAEDVAAVNVAKRKFKASASASGSRVPAILVTMGR